MPRTLRVGLPQTPEANLGADGDAYLLNIDFENASRVGGAVISLTLENEPAGQNDSVQLNS